MDRRFDERSPASAADTSATSPPKRRRAVQKKVVSVPIADVEGSRMKAEASPPSDSWAWRKYGQKPIKGSPYPRGYYRCSSSKGCPARKQVERSRDDPNMLVVTYACEHNHPWPASRTSSAAAAAIASPAVQEPPAAFAGVADTELEEKFPDLPEDTLLSDDFTWFSDVSSSPTVLKSPIFSGSGGGDAAAIVFPMGEEDESLFADLGELPECSLVYRRGLCEVKGSWRPAPWCGSTG